MSVRFQIHETSLCFVCSHLASGGRQGDEKYRNSNVAEILSRTTFPRGPLLDLPQKILDHEYVEAKKDLPTNHYCCSSSFLLFSFFGFGIIFIIYFSLSSYIVYMYTYIDEPLLPINVWLTRNQENKDRTKQ